MSDTAAPGAWVLDACVLYPTVLREILIGCAAAGLFAPLWSQRITGEWTRAAFKHGGAVHRTFAEGEIASLAARFPAAAVSHDPSEEADLWLPDPADIHVLATARAAGATGIVTLNLRDFPRHEVSALGLRVLHPDPFLLDLMATDPDTVASVAATVHAEAERLSGEAMDLRVLLKRARLPRLGKALTR